MRKANYCKEDIVEALKTVGIQNEDSIFVHSNIGFFGILKDAGTQKDYYRLFKEAIFEVIGPKGTLTVPTFSYSFCNNEKFSLKETKGVCGFFSEEVRDDCAALRSDDANFSIASIGAKAEYYTTNVDSYSFGSNSFWARFLKDKGKVCNFNFDSGSTFIHYVERELNVSYRYDKPFYGKIINNKEEYDKVFFHYVHDLNKPEYIADFSKFDQEAKKLGLKKIVNLGKGQIVSITAEHTYNLIKAELETNPSFLVKGK